MGEMILAPLRGVTIRAFRTTFAPEIAAAGFSEAFTPFIAALPGFDPLSDRELRERTSSAEFGLRLTPQFIGKDPAALGEALRRIKAVGFTTADLNAGCPFPMVRNKGRGAGLLRTPDVLCRMLEVGCEVMGPGNFSLKARLGVERTDELLRLMPLVNNFPLRFLTVHARTARQMYAGDCDWAAVAAVEHLAAVPVVRNGDLDYRVPSEAARMIGRGFIRALGARADASALVLRYLDVSQRELSGDSAVLGRLKELLAYWKDLPAWRTRWNVIKICRSVAELRQLL